MNSSPVADKGTDDETPFALQAPLATGSACCHCAAGRVLRLVLRLQQMPAAHWQEALGLALRSTCEILECDNAIFIDWRRAAQVAAEGAAGEGEALRNWKPCLLVDALGNRVEQERLRRAWENSVTQHGPDTVTLGVLSGTGSLRQCPCDTSGDPFHWLHCGENQPCADVAEHMAVAQGLDSLSESVICVERSGSSRFAADHSETLLLLMEATSDLHRRAMNGCGVFQEQQSLSPRERDILRELLTTASEKQIAARLGLTVRTTHQYVTSVYRKMKAHSRAELMARFFNSQDG